MSRHIGSKETRMYLKCLFLLPFFMLLALLFHQGYSIPGVLLPPCMFHTLTGFSCPGCGCTRAVIALLHGDILQSLCYNPGILYCAALYLLFLLSHTAAVLSSFIIRLYKKKLPFRYQESQQQKGSLLYLLNQIHGMKTRPVYLYTLIYLFLIFGVLRFFVELWQRLH